MQRGAALKQTFQLSPLSPCAYVYMVEFSKPTKISIRQTIWTLSSVLNIPCVQILRFSLKAQFHFSALKNCNS